MSVDPRRIRVLNHYLYEKGDIVYWMNREMRIHDNWALIAARDWAQKEGVGLRIVYNLDPEFLGGGRRQFLFKIDALKQLEQLSREKGIAFHLVIGSSTEKDLLEWVNRFRIGGIVTDFSPLRLPLKWIQFLQKKLTIPFVQVDAHNIVPCWYVSQKAEYGAYTLRPKLHKLLPEFLTPFPKLQSLTVSTKSAAINWKKVGDAFKGREIEPVTWIKSGEIEALKALNGFITHELSEYALLRNDPTKQGQSDLSPYLHYGMLSPQRVAYNVEHSSVSTESKKAFLEELIIRRELSDNFCFYHPDTYDTVECFPDWAKQDHAVHRKDKREYLYTFKQFEQAKTHDPLWNAAQMEMVQHGKMHGYMRMYWAKKILEWSSSPEEAMRIAITLNDRYELDGRDPNGYAGIAWSIGGVHDRPWNRRKIFGRVRYMNAAGCKRKFNTEAYITQILPFSQTLL